MKLTDLFRKTKFKNQLNETKRKTKRAELMGSGYPSYSMFGDNVNKDETVFSITQRIITEYSKLDPTHIRTANGRQCRVNDSTINCLLKYPNERETISDFLSKASFLYLQFDNVFIYPIYDLWVNLKTGKKKKIYKEFKILNPTHVDFYEDTAGRIYVEFTFAKGYKSGLIAYNDIVHWRRNYGEGEFLGGNERGLPNNDSFLKHLELNDMLLQSTIKTINGALSINGVIKYAGLINDADREKNRLKFIEQLSQGNGIIATDNGITYESIPFNGKVIDKDTLQFLDNKTRRHYGVSEAILDGDYTPEQKEAFYETVMESGIISLGLAFTRVLFTPFERANGNEIIFYSNKIMMMSHDKKIQLANLLMPVGGVTPNTVLSWFGQQPYEGGDRRYRFLNWIPEDIADAYQLETYKNGAVKTEPQNVDKEGNKQNEL